MKKSLIFTLLLLVGFVTTAGTKDDKYQKLRDLFEEGKYEDCAFKAEGYSLKDDMKKDAEPYLFLSMSLYQLSMLSSKEMEYPKAFDDAFKYAAKAAKYDKSGSIISDNEDYFEELKEAGIKEANNYFKSGNYSKTAKCLDRVLDFCPEDNYVRLTKGMCDILARNNGEGSMELKTAFTTINEYPLHKSSETSQKLLSQAFIQYSEYLNTENMKDSAKSTIDVAKVILPESPHLQAM